MRNRKALLLTAALALGAAVVLVPAGTFARGGGGFGGGARGPVFGFAHPRIVHRPIATPHLHRLPAHVLWKSSWWRLQRAARRRNDANASYPFGGDAGYGSSYYPSYPNDVTGSVASGPGFMPLPPASAPERAGCFSRGYDVPAESGGVTKVTVTRC